MLYFITIPLEWNPVEGDNTNYFFFALKHALRHH